MLVDLIGADAEQLAYRYAACDRKSTWITVADTGRVWNRFTATSEGLYPDVARGTGGEQEEQAPRSPT